jgi:hypothetical protein
MQSSQAIEGMYAPNAVIQFDLIQVEGEFVVLSAYSELISVYCTLGSSPAQSSIIVHMHLTI